MLKAFAGDRAKQEVASAIREIEAQTSAEVVVAVRAQAGFYRHADYLFGFAIALSALLLLLFHPHEFLVDLMPIDVLLAFVLGAVISASFWPLRRLLVSRRLMRSNVATAARAAFVDLGVSRTRGRSGILVFVAGFERTVEVVTDLGVDPIVLGTAWTEARGALGDAVSSSRPFERFLQALRTLGPVLGRALPRAADDVNELPDEVQEA